MSTTFLKDIEAFFSSVETSIAGKLSGATADTVKKVVATAAVAQHLSSVFATAETTWASLDGQSEGAIASSVAGLVHAGQYEQAAFGLLYLVYQGAIEVTSNASSLVQGVVADVKADVPAVVADVKADTSGVVSKVETAVEKVYDEAKNAVETVVQKVENFVDPAKTATAAPVVAPTPAPTPAPGVAAVNPPATTLQASGVPTVTQASPIQAATPAAVVTSQNNPM